MARTLYINDGSVELVLGDEKDTLQKIIRERLGDDCEELFKEITEQEEDRVHCGECRKCMHIVGQDEGDRLLLCEFWKGYPKVDPMDYCSFGERRSDDA